jgi:hypothetical protein
MYYSTPTTDENIDDRIHEWHDTPDANRNMSLIDWLNLSFDDYGHWFYARNIVRDDRRMDSRI